MDNDAKEKFKKEFSVRLVKFTITQIKLADSLADKKSLRSICDQMIRSSASIGANVTEARGASSKKDYIKFFEIALKSAYETQYWLTVLKYYDPVLAERVDLQLNESIELAKIIHSSVLTLKGKKQN